MNALQSAGDLQVGGLPLHPLIVHVIVVLVPLTALAIILGTLWPAARRRLGIVTSLAALVLVILVPITVAAGQSLEQLKENVKLERYKDWANYERLRANNVEAAYRNLLTYR